LKEAWRGFADMTHDKSTVSEKAEGEHIYRASDILQELNLVFPTIEEERLDEHGYHSRFTITPLAQGYGTTLGNALRRVLISSISGAAASYVKYDPKPLHEYSTIPGVKEDGIDLLLNFKGIKVALRSGVKKAILKLDVTGIGEVTTADIAPHNDVVILNPSHHLATLSTEKARLKVEIGILHGIGYTDNERISPKDLNDEWGGDQLPFGVIILDCKFSPIERVNYTVENTRVGQDTELDKLIIELNTNSAITCQDAMTEAANILCTYFSLFSTIPLEEGDFRSLTGKRDEMEELLARPLEDLELPVRPYNCLKQIGVKTIGELLQYPESELLKLRNFGEKSLEEIREKLTPLGLNLKGSKLER
jgi:DNA-directed RNA polymerase subunit alpha